MFALLGCVVGQPASLHIQILSGEGAVNYAKSRTNREIIVQVQDENNRPVGGATVALVLPQQGAGGTFSSGSGTMTATTDPKGQVIVRAIRPNHIAGRFEIHVTASYHGQTATTAVSQVNSAAASAGGAAAGGAALSTKALVIVIAAVAAGAAGGAIAATRGGSSSITPAATPTPAASVTIGSPSLGAPGH
jgi:hypothetical protein